MATIVEGIDDRTLLIAFVLYILFLVLVSFLVFDAYGLIGPVTPWGKRLCKRRDRETEKRMKKMQEAWNKNLVLKPGMFRRESTL
jgi:hypothetical protein